MNLRHRISKFKHVKSFFILFLYLFFWLCCGIMYWVIANSTQGESFLFQEDILLKSKNVIFQEKMNININYNITKELFKNFNKNVIPLKLTSNDNPVITYNYDSARGLSPIGNYWADYYANRWKNEGFNFFYLQLLESDDQIIGNEKYSKLRMSIIEIPEEYVMRKNVGEVLVLPIGEYFKYLSKEYDYYIWVPRTALSHEIPTTNKLYTFQDMSDKFFDISLIDYYLQNSINFFDDSIDVIYDIEINSLTSYSLVDFLYFSAITISTVGYGDILPNSSTVRVIVMLESMIGMVLLTIFISAFYDELKHFNKISIVHTRTKPHIKISRKHSRHSHHKNEPEEKTD